MCVSQLSPIATKLHKPLSLKFDHDSTSSNGSAFKTTGIELPKLAIVLPQYVHSNTYIYPCYLPRERQYTTAKVLPLPKPVFRRVCFVTRGMRLHYNKNKTFCRGNKRHDGITSPRLYNMQHWGNAVGTCKPTDTKAASNSKQMVGPEVTMPNESFVSSGPNHNAKPLTTLLREKVNKTHLQGLLSAKKKGLYKCGSAVHCSKTFASFGELLNHLEQHQIDRKFKCPDHSCPWGIVGFSSHAQMKRHYRTIHQPRSFSCPERLCKKTFSRVDLLKRHASSVHQNKNSRFNRKMGGTKI